MPNRSRLPEVRRSERGAVNPIREMSRLQRGLNRIFDDLISDPFSSWPSFAVPSLIEEAEFIPAAEIDETDTHYLLSFDLPGVKKEDLKLDLRNNQLTVSGERKEEFKGRGARERYYGSFSRSFILPSGVNADQVEAHFESGVLQIELPKSEPSKAKEIPIKEGKRVESKPEKKEAKSEKAA